MSQWDVIHPGRRLVKRFNLAANPLPEAQILKRIADFFAGKLPEAEKLRSEDADGGGEDEV